MKVILRSPFSQWSGYGRDGIGLAMGLLERGHQVALAPSDVSTPLPREIANLMTEPVTVSDVAIHHIEPHKAKLMGSDAAMARVSILWTMWGWRNLPDPARVPDDKAKWVEEFAENTKHFDYIAVYDNDSAEAFAPVVPTEKLIVVQGGYTARDWFPAESESPKSPDSPFVFGMVGTLGLRKGAYLAFQAFSELKEKHGDDFNARLEMYSTTPVFPGELRLPDWLGHHVARMLPPQLRETYLSFDTLLAPSMADAKHLPPIEALSCGVPVILSDIAGHRTWADSSMVTWVSTHDGHLAIPEVIYKGAEVELESLKAAMWDHYQSPAAHRQKALLGARTLPAMMDWTKCLERLGIVTRTLL